MNKIPAGVRFVWYDAMPQHRGNLAGWLGCSDVGYDVEALRVKKVHPILDSHLVWTKWVTTTVNDRHLLKILGREQSLGSHIRAASHRS